MPTISNKEKIKEDIVQQLYWDNRVDAANVKVSVNDSGRVELSGKVPSYYAQEAAESSAWVVNGVTEIVNILKVQYPSTVELPNDTKIEENVNNSLLWNPEIDSSNVEVSVDNNIVTLEGSVETFWKKKRAMELADSAGVIDVIDKLTVVPSEDLVDKDIAEDVVDAIDRNLNVEAEDIDIKIDKGKVTLNGTVPNWNAYKAAENSAFYTLGVKEVVNNLDIEN